MKHILRAFLVVMMMPILSFGAVKAVVSENVPDQSNQRWQIEVIYFDEDLGTLNIANIDIPLTGYSGDETVRGNQNGIITAIVNNAVNVQGYVSFTSKDVLLSWPYGDTSSQQALEGTLSTTIDGKSVGNTTVLTNNSGRDFVVTNVTVVTTAVAGLGTAPIINVGKTASSYNDIATGFSLSPLGAVGKTVRVTTAGDVPLVADGESVVCRVATAAILTTTFDFKCLVQGVYIN